MENNSSMVANNTNMESVRSISGTARVNINEIVNPVSTSAQSRSIQSKQKESFSDL